MFEVTRVYEDAISCAHTLPGHDKCGRVHGHNYTIEVVCGAVELDNQGMVIDFHVLDGHVKPLLNLIDHRFLDTFNNDHPSGVVAANVAILPIPWTTAEWLAHWIYDRLKEDGLKSIKEVSVWENKRSKATYRQ